MLDRPFDLNVPESEFVAANSWWRSLSINQMKDLERKYFPDIRNFTKRYVHQIWEEEVSRLPRSDAMTKSKTAEPRTYRGFFSATHRPPQVHGETWLEAEEFCYPNGGMSRRCRARCEDDVLRVVRCSVPDTFFSIPARCVLGAGFVSSDEEGFKFTLTKPRKKR